MGDSNFHLAFDRDDELEQARLDLTRLESGRQSQSTNASSEESELEVLKRQLQQKEQKLKEKEDQLKEKEDRLSVMER